MVVVNGAPAEMLAKRPSTTEGWAESFCVAVAREDASDLPAMFGSYRVDDGAIVFWPRYSFRPGLAYRATFQVADSSPIEHRFTLPDPSPSVPTTVRAVYPSADRLPENLLKFYVHFSAPMRQGVAYDHVRLQRADGTLIPDPFVNVGQELWDRSGQRLTLIFDPGRIKHGLRSREEMGPVLEAGHDYRLVIDNTWKDASGRPLAKAFAKRFRVTEPDTLPPDPLKWQVSCPSAGTIAPLSIEFPEPMDHALAHDSIEIVAPNGQSVEGTVALANGEQHWQFTPSNVWTPGEYSIVVDPRLEDLAAHSVGRPFEVKIGPDGKTPPPNKAVRLPVSIE